MIELRYFQGTPDDIIKWGKKLRIKNIISISYIDDEPKQAYAPVYGVWYWGVEE